MATPKKIFLKIFVKNMFLGVILCEKSIARIPEAWKRFLDPDSGKELAFSHKNPKMFDFRFNTPTTFPESGPRKRFHASGMRAIDFRIKLPLEGHLFKKIFLLDHNLDPPLILIN